MNWKSVLLACLLVVPAHAVEIADPIGDVDVSCVDFSRLSVEVAGDAILAIAEFDPAQHTPTLTRPHRNKTHCASFTVTVEFDTDGDAEENLSLQTTIRGPNAFSSGPDSLATTFDRASGRVVWELDVSDLGIQRDADLVVHVRARAVAAIDGVTTESLEELRDEDIVPNGWAPLVIPADSGGVLALVAFPHRHAGLSEPISVHAMLPPLSEDVFVSYRWTIISSDSANSETFATQAPVFHRTYEQPQLLKVYLTAETRAGRVLQAVTPYSILTNLPPIARAEPRRQIGTILSTTPQYVCQATVSACRSLDLDGQLVAIEVHWGDGFSDIQLLQSGQCQLTHAFLQSLPEGFDVSVVVYDDGDGSDGACSTPVSQADLVRCSERRSTIDTVRVICLDPAP